MTAEPKPKHPLAPARTEQEADIILRDEGLPTMAEQLAAARDSGDEWLAGQIERYLRRLRTGR